jgi:hypothetical protein
MHLIMKENRKSCQIRALKAHRDSISVMDTSFCDDFVSVVPQEIEAFGFSSSVSRNQMVGLDKGGRQSVLLLSM